MLLPWRSTEERETVQQLLALLWFGGSRSAKQGFGPPKQSMSVDCWRQEAVGLRKGEREITKMIIKALRNIILLGT